MTIDIDQSRVGEKPGFPIASVNGILYASAPADLDPGQTDLRACWNFSSLRMIPDIPGSFQLAEAVFTAGTGTAPTESRSNLGDIRVSVGIGVL